MKLARTIVAMVFFGLAGIAQANVAISGNVMTTNPPCSQSAASSGSTVSINLLCVASGGAAHIHGAGDLNSGVFQASASSVSPLQEASFDLELRLSQDYLFTGPSGLAEIQFIAPNQRGDIVFTLLFDGQTFDEGSPGGGHFFFDLTHGQTYYLQLSVSLAGAAIRSDDGGDFAYVIDQALTPVPGIPEPSSFALMATGLLAAAKLVRNRHARLP